MKSQHSNDRNPKGGMPEVDGEAMCAVAEPEGFDLRAFSRVNRARAEDPLGFDHPLKSWSPAEWTNALCGEAGEAANLTKKILRIDKGLRGNLKVADQHRGDLVRRARRELADVIVYADLAIQALDGDTADEVRRTFDAKSAEIGWEYSPRVVQLQDKVERLERVLNEAGIPF